MKYKVKTLKFSNALLNKESFRFLNQLRRSLYLNRGLTYLIKQNEKRDHNTLQKYNLMWVKIANLDLSSKNDMKYFLKEIIKSQCFFFIYQIKINAGKVLKLNETVDKIHRKLALYRKLDSWYLFMRKTFNLDNLVKALIKTYKIRTKINHFEILKNYYYRLKVTI